MSEGLTNDYLPNVRISSYILIPTYRTLQPWEVVSIGYHTVLTQWQLHLQQLLCHHTGCHEIVSASILHTHFRSQASPFHATNMSHYLLFRNVFDDPFVELGPHHSNIICIFYSFVGRKNIVHIDGELFPATVWNHWHIGWIHRVLFPYKAVKPL